MSAVERPDHSFNENSPRPPVPGEETEFTGPTGAQSPTNYSSWCSKHNKGGNSPVLTPRRSSLAYTTSGLADAGAPLGFEPEGSCSTAFMEGGGGSRSPPPYLRWARNLHSLLEDSDGVDLFRRYLEQEGRPHADTLDFWFACEGLKKQQDPDKIMQLVKVIHRRFLLKTQLAIPEDIRKEVNRRIKEGKDLLDGNVFDGVQTEVEHLIRETTYPNFLKSDMYLHHVRTMQNSELLSGFTSSTGSSGSSSGGGRDLSGGGQPLPTLHEDTELVTGMGSVGGSKSLATGHDVLPLTKDMLMKTQKRRAFELRPKPEAYAGMYLQHANYPFVHPSQPHMAYSSYNPVSRQDSELQSLSSGARTESDNVSLNDSTVDGISASCYRGSSKKQYMTRVNKDPYTHQMVIPRTQRNEKDQVRPIPIPLVPEEFASILVEKLEAVKRKQEAQEKLDRKLQEVELVSGVEETSVVDSMAAPHSLADAIREKLVVDDDSDQAILDQHVSRVWSDLTPSLSPGISPRPKSPEARRRTMPGTAVTLSKISAAGRTLPGAAIPSHSSSVGLIHGVPHPYQSHSRPAYYPRHMRKEKDVFSTFSSDSGNVHDFAEGSEHKHHGGSGHMPKSKSMPDYQDTQKQDGYSSMPGHDFRFRQNRDSSRKSSSKKMLADLTDSGVSVVSYGTPVMHPSPQSKDKKVSSWLMETDKQVSSASHCHSEREVSKHRFRRNDPSATSPVATRYSRKLTATYSTSRSGSLERGSSGGAGPGGAWGPAQPFVADPSMPPLPQPHTDTQLEEARRRLEEDARAKTVRQRVGTSSSKTSGTAMHASQDAPLSGQTTLRKSLRGGRSSLPGAASCVESSEFTIVVYSFCDEQLPYRNKIPARPVTLRQFKEYLPKKGSYRYFFKTECDYLDTKVIQEEITDDNEILPLWEGKIMALVKPVE